MSKAVLISIRPDWCKKIFSGEKTTEIRKSRPNLETPFRCYIYCAMPVGNVIGEFTCDRIRFYSGKSWLVKEDVESVTAGSCLSLEQVKEYAGWRKAASFMDRKDLYAWHISDLKIYDKPLPLGNFIPNCCYLEDEAGCRAYREHGCSCPDQRYDLNPDGSVNMAICQRNVKRPPQSWCYVEEKDIVDLLYSNKEENNA